MGKLAVYLVNIKTGEEVETMKYPAPTVFGSFGYIPALLEDGRMIHVTGDTPNSANVYFIKRGQVF